MVARASPCLFTSREEKKLTGAPKVKNGSMAVVVEGTLEEHAKDLPKPDDGQAENKWGRSRSRLAERRKQALAKPILKRAAEQHSKTGGLATDQPGAGASASDP